MFGPVFAALLIAAPEDARVNRLPPVDRCAGDASFAAFRDLLRSRLRSFAGYRAVFERRGGRWLMTAFVAGD
jgi:hypothetical protein